MERSLWSDMIFPWLHDLQDLHSRNLIYPAVEHLKDKVYSCIPRSPSQSRVEAAG